MGWALISELLIPAEVAGRNTVQAKNKAHDQKYIALRDSLGLTLDCFNL